MVDFFSSVRSRFSFRWWKKTSRIRYYWYGVENSCFLWLDVLLLLAGIPSASTSKWPHERTIRYISTCLFVLQSMLYVQQTINAIADRKENMPIFLLEVVKTTSIALISLKLLLMIHLRKPLDSVRSFINSDRVRSGDDAYDELVYGKFNRSGRRMIRVIFGLIGLEAVLMTFPCSTTRRVFRLPRQLMGAGKNVASLVNFLYLGLLPVGMCPRFFTNLTSLGILLMGMRAKLKILAHRYQRMLAQSPLEETQYYKFMVLEVREIMDQQLEFSRHLKILKQMVGKAFSLVHYFSIYAIGTMFYVSKIMGLNTTAIMLVASTAWLLLEYYLWCQLVDSLKDEAESFGLNILEICCVMPFKRKYASYYIQLRTSLMISWISMRNGLSMNCLGLFEISTAAFVALLNIVYTVVTFLLNIN
ncbi:uncharacterized protein LOC134292026 [Aedes albopictus]|uniref:Odorant receptor n=1 Tax=Aedes albopictus TaxID=7160 RepID=A0ABM1ZYV6_AEDAL